jgi:transposase
MVRYKGARQGMRVKPLSGAFSSRDCSRCDSRKTRRSGAAFACQRCGYGLNAHLNGARNMSWRAARYIRAAAGRAGEKTAERQSGPEGKCDEERPLSSHNVSLQWPFRVLPKPRTLVRGS